MSSMPVSKASTRMPPSAKSGASPEPAERFSDFLRGTANAAASGSSPAKSNTRPEPNTAQEQKHSTKREPRESDRFVKATPSDRPPILTTTGPQVIPPVLPSSELHWSSSASQTGNSAGEVSPTLLSTAEPSSQVSPEAALANTPVMADSASSLPEGAAVPVSTSDAGTKAETPLPLPAEPKPESDSPNPSPASPSTTAPNTSALQSAVSTAPAIAPAPAGIAPAVEANPFAALSPALEPHPSAAATHKGTGNTAPDPRQIARGQSTGASVSSPHPMANDTESSLPAVAQAAESNQRQPHHDPKSDAANPTADRHTKNSLSDDQTDQTSNPVPALVRPSSAPQQSIAAASIPTPAPAAPVQEPAAPGSSPREALTAPSATVAGEQPSPAAPSPLSAVETARLVKTAAGSELRVATRSDEFGLMTIHTVLGQQQISAHISLENERLTSILSGHLSTIQERLESSLGPGLGVKATVSLGSESSHPGNQGSNHRENTRESAGAQGQSQQSTNRQREDGRATARPQSSPQSNSSGRGRFVAAAASAATVAPTSRGRLDIHI